MQQTKETPQTNETGQERKKRWQHIEAALMEGTVKREQQLAKKRADEQQRLRVGGYERQPKKEKPTKKEKPSIGMLEKLRLLEGGEAQFMRH